MNILDIKELLKEETTIGGAFKIKSWRCLLKTYYNGCSDSLNNLHSVICKVIWDIRYLISKVILK